MGFKVTRPIERRRPISKEESFDECVILNREAFDPDAVFMEDIVADDLLPRLSLAVDGLTESGDARNGRLDMPSENTIVNEIIRPSSTMPVAALDADILEVYGWESSFWRKVCGYLGF